MSKAPQPAPPRLGFTSRAVKQVRTSVANILPTTWMSPSQPMPPMAQEAKGRLFDFPVARNIQYQPRSAEPVSFAQLRAFADNCDLLRLVIETRKDQIDALDWVIRPRSKGGKSPVVTPDMASRIDAITTFFQKPSTDNDWSQWVRQILEQQFVYDALSIERRRTRGGQICALPVLDGTTISVMLDANGQTPASPSVAYQQVLKGLPAVDFNTDELLYYPRNRRPGYAYGYPIVQQIINYVTLSLKRMRQQANAYDAANSPVGLVEAPPSLTVDQITAMQDYWDATFMGDQAMAARALWVPSGSTYTEIKRDILFDDFDEWLARVICYAFSIPPTPFIKANNRATATQTADTGEAEGLEPTKRFTARLVTGLIATDFNSPDLEFAWDGKKEVDPGAQATIHDLYTRNGTMSIDAVREDLGQDPLGGAFATPMFATVTGYVPVDPEERQQQAIETAKAMPQAPAPAQLGPDGKPLPPKPSVPGANPASQAQGGSKVSAEAPNKGAKALPPKTGALPPGKAPLTKGVDVGPFTIVRSVINSHELVAWARQFGCMPGTGLEVRYPSALQKSDSADLALILVENHAGRLVKVGQQARFYFASDALAKRAEDVADQGAATFAPFIIVDSDFSGTLPDDNSYGGNLLLGPEKTEDLSDFMKHWDIAAHDADPMPTEPQKVAGNYRMGHIRFQGLNITIENPAGTARTGPDWYTLMPTHYGYIRSTVGADGDHMDVFVGPNDQSQRVWVIDQKNLDSETFDEHKVLLGYDNMTEARDAYARSFSDGKGDARIANMKAMTMPEFKSWLALGDTTKPLALAKGVGKTGRRPFPLGTATRLGSYGFSKARNERFVSPLSKIPNRKLPPGKGFDWEGKAALVEQYKAAVLKALRAVQAKAVVTARNVLASKTLPLAKAAKETDEERSAREQAEAATAEFNAWADEVAAAIDTGNLELLVSTAQEVGIEVYDDGATATLASLGYSNNSELVNQSDRLATAWAKDRAAELVGMRWSGDTLVTNPNALYAIEESTRDMVRQVIADALEAGDVTLDEVADELAGDAYPFSPERAAIIASTEIARAHGEGALAMAKEAEALGNKVLKGWIVADTPCPICDANNEQGYIALDDEFESGDMTTPGHPNCLIGETKITAVGSIAAATERWFKGDIIVIRTSANQELRLTANHPVLTSHGWVAAGLLKEGHDVIGGSFLNGPALPGPHHNNVPTRIQEITHSLGEASGGTTSQVATSPEDFHGDGANSEITVIRTNGALLGRHESSGVEHFKQNNLVSAYVGKCGFSGLSSGNQFLNGSGTTPGSRMSGSSPSLSLLGSGPPSSYEHRLGNVAGGHASILEPQMNGPSAHAKTVGQRQSGLPRLISLDDFSDWKINPIRHVITYAGKRSFEGYVYNIQTESGFYLAEGLVVHNCRCALDVIAGDDIEEGDAQGSHVGDFERRAPLAKYNENHVPSGSPEGGQFAPASGGTTGGGQSDKRKQAFEHFERQKGLDAADKAVEDRSIARYLDHHAELVHDYEARNGNKVVNVDEARPLFKDDGYNGRNSAAVQEASSALAKDVWREALANNPGKEAWLYAGGSGSGKTSSIEKMLPGIKDSAAAILDGNLSKISSAMDRIKEARGAGKIPSIAYVYREPSDAWENGVVKRMLDNPREAGRVVPLSTFLQNTAGSLNTARQLKADGFNVVAIDNGHGAGARKVMSDAEFSRIPVPDVAKMKADLTAVTDRLLSSGRISKEQHHALLQ